MSPSVFSLHWQTESDGCFDPAQDPTYITAPLSALGTSPITRALTGKDRSETKVSHICLSWVERCNVITNCFISSNFLCGGSSEISLLKANCARKLNSIHLHREFIAVFSPDVCCDITCSKVNIIMAENGPACSYGEELSSGNPELNREKASLAL